jgi:hypothetical protein
VAIGDEAVSITMHMARGSCKYLRYHRRSSVTSVLNREGLHFRMFENVRDVRDVRDVPDVRG